MGDHLHLNSTIRGPQYDAKIPVESNVLNVVDVTETFRDLVTKAATPFRGFSAQTPLSRRLDLVCEDEICTDNAFSLSTVVESWLLGNSVFLIFLLIVAVSCWFLGRWSGSKRGAYANFAQVHV